jgi:hypothetical protein
MPDSGARFNEKVMNETTRFEMKHVKNLKSSNSPFKIKQNSKFLSNLQVLNPEDGIQGESLSKKLENYQSFSLHSFNDYQ